MRSEADLKKVLAWLKEDPKAVRKAFRNQGFHARCYGCVFEWAFGLGTDEAHKIARLVNEITEQEHE